MTEWQERVVLEKQDLDAKGEALHRWLMNPPMPDVKTIEAVDIDLLGTQYLAMKTYSNILGMRIARFK